MKFHLRLDCLIVVCGTLALFQATPEPLLAQAPASLPDAPGKGDIQAKCSQCHSVDNVVARHRSPQEWQAVVERMVTRGAVLNASEQARVLTYLSNHFSGPEAASTRIETARHASPSHTLRARHAGLVDYIAMPATGNFTVKDTRSQVARLNFLVEEPVGSHIFVGDSAGLLYRIDKANKDPIPFIDFKALFPRFVAETSFASGLLALTFDPDYRRNGRFYTIHMEDMTQATPADPRSGVMPGLNLGTYKVTAGVPTPSGPVPLIREAVVVEWTHRATAKAFSGSAREILRVQLMNSVHPTNDLSFNPAARPGDADWRVLYISTGDSGAGEQSDIRRLNPQRLDHFGGKIIRIIPDLTTHIASSVISENGQYRIPRDNPFFSLAGARKEIWATGMRNPHRMTWDGGKMLAFVIGSNGLVPGPRYETINLIRRGANFGYPLREGPEFKALSPIFGSVPTDHTLPLRISDKVVLERRVPLQDSALAYKTTVEGNAISNGFVYRGKRWPMLKGMVVFGDITSGRIFYARMTDLDAATDGKPTTLASFGEIRTELPILAAKRMQQRTPLGSAAGANTTGGRPFRIDMRLATDRSGEIYVITKSDGMIRRIASVR